MDFAMAMHVLLLNTKGVFPIEGFRLLSAWNCATG
jgi:hypothetical protein